MKYSLLQNCRAAFQAGIFKPAPKMGALQLFSGLAVSLFLTLKSVNALGYINPDDLWPNQAISSNSAAANDAITQLRNTGPAGLETLFRIHHTKIEQLKNSSIPLDDEAKRLRYALDEVGKQRDCYASGLYWYTDLEKAKAAAQEQGKPILSLRLLGNLNEELSCANSRFFRTALYPNKEISQKLKNDFILHWKSVRPVPLVTIDFRDGRVIKQPITGNSIHYVLSSDGAIIDALPGLFGPQSFLNHLNAASQASAEYLSQPADKKKLFLAEYHQKQQEQILNSFKADLSHAVYPHSQEPPISEITRPVDRFPFDSPLWNKIAALHTEDARVDSASRSLAERKYRPYPTAAQAAPMAMSKMVMESPLLKSMREFENTMALDTVRNEYVLHHQILSWFQHQPLQSLDELNERIYSELFLTPSSDPNLGLISTSYPALEKE
jgi:hypothetical protein